MQLQSSSGWQGGGAVTEDTPEAVGSRVEAAIAGVHHEQAEVAAGVVPPREHVSADGRVPPDATDVATPHLAHHHPEDINAGIVRGRPARGVVVAALLTAAVTVAGVVLLALAVGGGH
jgi:hypothetical protein